MLHPTQWLAEEQATDETPGTHSAALGTGNNSSKISVQVRLFERWRVVWKAEAGGFQLLIGNLFRRHLFQRIRPAVTSPSIALSDATRRLLADKTRSTRAARVFPSCRYRTFILWVDTHPATSRNFYPGTVRALPTRADIALLARAQSYMQRLPARTVSSCNSLAFGAFMEVQVAAKHLIGTFAGEHHFDAHRF